MRRRLMLHKADRETIPIGVNFFDASKSQGGFLDKRATLPTKTAPIKSSGSYRVTNKMPYDSAYSFSVSGITTAGNTTGCGIDADGYYRLFIGATNGSGIKSAITTYEQNSGIKIVAVQFSYGVSNSPVWKRIS